MPVVPVHSDKEMNRRKILAKSRRAQKDRNQLIELLQEQFLSQGIINKVHKDLGNEEVRKEAIKELTGIERDEAEHLVKLLDLCEKWIEKLNQITTGESAGDEE